MGTATPSTRIVEVCSSFPPDCGTLLSPTNEWANEATQDVTNAAPTTGTSLSQAIRVRSDADSYRHVEIWMGLYLDDPTHEDGVEVVVETNLIQQVNLRVQISSLHNYNPQSRFLLVTNSESTATRVQAIQNFINDNLGMQLDRWNVSLYGGLEQPAEEGEDSPRNIISRYHGKSIIFLGDPFKFFDAGQRDITEFCDVRTLAQASLQGTSYYFLGSSGHPALQRLLERLVFPMPYSAANVVQSLPDSEDFGCREDLIRSITESKLIGEPQFHVYTVPVEGRWYRFGKASTRSEVKKLARYLRQQLPQERFLVAPMADSVGRGPESTGLGPVQAQTNQQKQSKRSLGKFAILHGCPHEVSAIATEPRYGTSHLLDAFEKFMLIRTLPASTRIEILWTRPDIGTVGVQDEDSTNAFKYIFLSLLTDLNLEIQNFLHKARWPNKAKCSNNPQESRNFLPVHLPLLFKLLDHQNAKTSTRPPDHVIELLQHAEASCHPQKKRHISRTILLPLLQRRTHLRNLLRSTINAFLTRKSYTKKEIAAFHSGASSLHSNLDSNQRNTGKVILRQVSEVTRKSHHQYERGHRTASTAVARTMYCSEQQWRHRWQGIEDAGVMLAEETARARKELGRMILDVDVGEGVIELEG